jgi:hypothetical protein
VTVKFTANSPLIASMLALFSNPMLMGAQGGKVEKVGGEKASFKYDPNDEDGQVQLVINGKLLVEVEGSDLDEKSLRDYANSIDVAALKKQVPLE